MQCNTHYHTTAPKGSSWESVAYRDVDRHAIVQAAPLDVEQRTDDRNHPVKVYLRFYHHPRGTQVGSITHVAPVKHVAPVDHFLHSLSNNHAHSCKSLLAFAIKQSRSLVSSIVTCICYQSITLAYVNPIITYSC
jgi:hypothetical protein